MLTEVIYCNQKTFARIKYDHELATIFNITRPSISNFRKTGSFPKTHIYDFCSKFDVNISEFEENGDEKFATLDHDVQELLVKIQKIRKSEKDFWKLVGYVDSILPNIEG